MKTLGFLGTSLLVTAISCSHSGGTGGLAVGGPGASEAGDATLDLQLVAGSTGYGVHVSMSAPVHAPGDTDKIQVELFNKSPLDLFGFAESQPFGIFKKYTPPGSPNPCTAVLNQEVFPSGVMALPSGTTLSSSIDISFKDCLGANHPDGIYYVQGKLPLNGPQTFPQLDASTEPHNSSFFNLPVLVSSSVSPGGLVQDPYEIGARIDRPFYAVGESASLYAFYKHYGNSQDPNAGFSIGTLCNVRYDILNANGAVVNFGATACDPVKGSLLQGSSQVERVESLFRVPLRDNQANALPSGFYFFRILFLTNDPVNFQELPPVSATEITVHFQIL